MILTILQGYLKAGKLLLQLPYAGQTRKDHIKTRFSNTAVPWQFSPQDQDLCPEAELQPSEQLCGVKDNVQVMLHWWQMLHNVDSYTVFTKENKLYFYVPG